MTVFRILMILWLTAYPLESAVSETAAVQLVEQLDVPLTETAFNAKKWLINSGLAVEQTNLTGGGIRLTGQSSEERKVDWLIELRPFSSLGTTIQLQLDGPEATQDEAEQLIASLKEAAQVQHGLFAEGSRAIPEPVLNQIGNVACVHVQSKGRVVQFTGFFIDSDGLVLCTAHDLAEHEQVGVMSNTGIFYEGTIIKADFERDLALIKVDASKEEIVEVVDGRNLLGMGEIVFSIGCPINLRGTIESGFINGPPRKIDQLAVWQAQMRIQPGSSGSPVFDNTGAFVAVVKGRHREADDIGFLIPLEVVIDFLKEYFSS